jgi:hypothetical protein
MASTPLGVASSSALRPQCNSPAQQQVEVVVQHGPQQALLVHLAQGA